MFKEGNNDKTQKNKRQKNNNELLIEVEKIAVDRIKVAINGIKDI